MPGGASSATKSADSFGEAGDDALEVRKVMDDLISDGKETYGPWLLVRRKKAGAKVGGSRNPIHGVGVGLGKRYFRKSEDSTKKVHMAHDRPPYSVRIGPMDAAKEVGQSPVLSQLKIGNSINLITMHPLNLPAPLFFLLLRFSPKP